MTEKEKLLAFKIECELMHKPAFMSALRDIGGEAVTQDIAEMCWSHFSKGILQAMWAWPAEHVAEQLKFYAEDYINELFGDCDYDNVQES